MKKWIRIAITSALIVSTRCIARQERTQTLQEKMDQAFEQSIAQRKQQEQRNAKHMIDNAKLKTAHRRAKRAKAEQDDADHQARINERKAYHEQVQRFAQLTQELALPIYTERPLLDIIHEAEFTIQQIAIFNPNVAPSLQLQLERALKQGKHPVNAAGKKLYPNAEIIAQQSMVSLIDQTYTAHQQVQEAAARAQEVSHTVQKMNREIAQSQQRIAQCDTKLAQLNATLRKDELEASQKEAEAINLAQCIDTFNTVSSKLNQDRIGKTEELIRILEQKAHAAEQQTTLLMLRLQYAQKALTTVEKGIKTSK